MSGSSRVTSRSLFVVVRLRPFHYVCYFTHHRSRHSLLQGQQASNNCTRILLDISPEVAISQNQANSECSDKGTRRYLHLNKFSHFVEITNVLSDKDK